MISGGHRIMVKEIPAIIIEAHRDKITQVLTSFLNNAVKYSRGEKEVWMSFITTETEVEILMTDNEIGINPDEHEEIFQRRSSYAMTDS